MPGLVIPAVPEAVVPTVASESKLQACTPEGQELRRQMLRGARVLVIQAGYESKRFIYERMHALGVCVTILDGSNHWSKSLVGEEVATNFIDVEPLPFENLYERSIAAIKASGLTFDGIVTFWEEAVPLSNRLGDALGLPCNPLSACEIARNKGRTREALRTSGLPSSKYFRIHARSDLAAACAEVGFPAVLKPVYGAASRGVIRVESEEEVYQNYDELTATLTADIDPIWAQGVEFVLEEYYDGDEFDIDVLLCDGVPRFCKVSDNWPCQPPFYQESGENAPSLAPAGRQRELERLAVDSLRAMGFQRGCFHVEAKYTSRGPRLIEVNARMGGMGVRDVYLHAYGVDFVEEHVMSHVGIPIAPMSPERPLKHVAMAFVTAPFSGAMRGGDWLADVRTLPGVISADVLAKEGVCVTGPEHGVPNFIGQVIVESDRSVQAAIQLTREIVASIAPPVISDKEGRPTELYFPVGFPVDVPEEC